MTDTLMDAAELCRARDLLGYTDGQLAADLGLSPGIVSAWTSSRAPVPRHVARDLRWRAALIERDQMLAKSGLPECDWVNAWDAEPLPAKLEARLERLEALRAHAGACSTCKAREAYACEHCPPLPERPMPFWVKGASLLAGLAARLPNWAEPAVWVGAAFGAYSLFRIVILGPRIVAHPRLALTAVEGLLLSISIGAAVGALYGGSKELWERLKARRIV